MAGEHIPVWHKICQLSPLRVGHPSTEDAISVVHETMRRARSNVEVLISRLYDLGYEFASFQPVYTEPGSDVCQRLSYLESLGGSLPLALRTWHETVGSVCLMGSHPKLAFYSDSVLRDPPEVYSDPLVVLPIKVAIEELEGRKMAPDPKVSYPLAIPIAPDEYHKENVSGGAPYEILVPSSDVDPPLLNEWHNTTFVEYLRICFHWGGFPGWERYEDRPDGLLQKLSDGLLPI